MSARGPQEPQEIFEGVVVEEEQEAPAPAAAPIVREPAPLPVRSSLPTAQAAAVAVSGFAAGALTAAVVHGVGRRRAMKAAARKPARSALPVLGTRSFLVDVHLLGGKD